MSELASAAVQALSDPRVWGTGAAILASGAAAFAWFSQPATLSPKPPAEMKALMLKAHLKSYEGKAEDLAPHFEVQTIPTPKLRAGQVLVKVYASPINPSDLSTLTGSYNAAQRDALPCQLGFEASGLVVATGGGVMARRLLGKRVAVASTKGGRMWAEYAIGNAMTAVVLPDDVSYTAGCSVFVNPLTAMGFIETAHAAKAKAVLHTAGGSALGKMLIRLGVKEGVKVIPVVRRAAQREELMAMGATEVVVTSEEGWQTRLADLCKTHNVKMGFDAVAGPQTGEVLKAMPGKSTLYVYGGLSKQSCGTIRPTDLIFRGSSLKGWWLTPHVMGKSLVGKIRMVNKVTSELNDALSTTIRGTYPIEKAAEALADATSNMSAGKITFAPNGAEPSS